jgi:hypothetical protein
MLRVRQERIGEAEDICRGGMGFGRDRGMEIGSRGSLEVWREAEREGAEGQ